MMALFALGILLGWAFAVMMGEVRKSETTVNYQTTVHLDGAIIDAVAEAVARRLEVD